MMAATTLAAGTTGAQPTCAPVPAAGNAELAVLDLLGRFITTPRETSILIAAVRADDHTSPLARALIRHCGDRLPLLRPCPLTPRELDVLAGLAGGKSGPEIACDLGVALTTVRQYTHRIYRRLGVGDRAQAVLIAYQAGWLVGRGGRLERSI